MSSRRTSTTGIEPPSTPLGLSGCERSSQVILDDSPAGGLEQHLIGCAACRQLAKAHRSALALRGVAPVARSVSRARVLRRAGALALVLVAAGVVVASRQVAPVPGVGEVVDSGALAIEGRLVVAPPGEAGEAEWNALIALHDAVALETRRDLRVNDSTYTPFGALPAWVAPTSLQPMRSLGPAVSPLVYTPED